MDLIPKDNLGYPVLVKLDSGSLASGFYYRNGDEIYFVTARHVLFTQKNGVWEINAEQAILTSYPHEIDWTAPTIYELDLKTIYSNNGIKYDNENDIAVLKTSIKQEGTSNQFLPINGVKKISGHNIVLAHEAGVRLFSDVAEGNDVYLFGYPSSLGIRDVPQIEYNKPLLRKGCIAQKNEKQRTIILDCPVYYGNSGGPVTEVVPIAIGKCEFPIIGVVSQFVPFVEEWENVKHGYTNIEYENSGYSVVVPIDFVLKLIKNFNK